MTRRNLLILGAVAALLLAAGVWLSVQRSSSQAASNGGPVLDDLTQALGDIEELRFSRGDGSRTTLRRGADGWMVVERNYPADPARVRELALGLAGLKVVERKTRDPANYAKLGVEAPDTPTATSTLVEIVAGERTWSLIVGKAVEGRAVYVRKPDDAATSLAQPFVAVDPDQKRWVDRLLTDIKGSEIHDIEVKMGKSPAYRLTRAQRDAADLALSPLPRGRTAISSMSLNGAADALTSFNFDEVRALPATTTVATDTATFRAFDGQVIEFAGRREGDKSYVTVGVRRDAALAAQFPLPAPTDPASTSEMPAPAVDRLAARTAGMEFEIPAYKYEAIFRPHEELVEKKP